ncbi:MAG: hypothetical protein R2792_04210 [Saprospiraceae bacterium]
MAGWLPEEPPAIYLNLEELNTLFELDLSNNPRLNKCRIFPNWLLYRFEIFRLTQLHAAFQKNGKRKEIIMMTTKDRRKGFHPGKIRTKSNFGRNNYQLPKAISNQNFNAYLKGIGPPCRPYRTGLNDPF